MGETRCTKCGQTKPDESFYFHSKRQRLTQPCKTCYQAWHRERYQPKYGTDDEPRACAWCGSSYRPKQRRVSRFCSAECKQAERVASGRERELYLQRRYGITAATYDRMLDEQGGGCALCGKKPEDQTRYGNYLHVDHCHDTGKVRGLLCDQHNLLIGRWNHDTDMLRAVIAYLEK